MRRLDPQTEMAVRTFLARIPPELKIEKAIVFGSRARGDNKPDGDADLALVFERGNEWPIVGMLAGLAFDVLMETGNSRSARADFHFGLDTSRGIPPAWPSPKRGSRRHSSVSSPTDSGRYLGDDPDNE